MSQTVQVVFHGLFVFRFETDRCRIGIVNGANHAPGLAVYCRSDGGVWELMSEHVYGESALVGDTSITVAKQAAPRVAAIYTNPPDWSNPPLPHDFRWVLDMEQDLYGHALAERQQNYYGALTLNDGVFCTQARTADPIRIVEPNTQNPVHQRKLAAIVRADITLEQPGDQVIINLNRQSPITLSYRPGRDYRIAIRNYEPAGVSLHDNHLGLLSRVLDLQHEVAYRFHPDDEHKDIEAGFDWVYPNKRPPAHCPGATLGISFPIPVA